MGYLRANHPTVGYVPPGALRLAKDLGLAVFMVSTGLKAGGGIEAGGLRPPRRGQRTVPTQARLR